MTRPDPRPRSSSSSRRSTALPWVVALVAALVALTAFVLPRTGEDSSDGGDAAAASSERQVDPEYGDLAAFERRTPDDPTALGDQDAPVVMVAYSDFQCPYCGKFARDTEKKLISKYVDTGVLRIEWRDFPYLGEESVRSAHAARAAAAQGKFWEYHDALYARQFPPNSGKLTRQHLLDVAGQVGLDTEKFTEDMDSKLTAKLVQHDFDEAMSIGLSGTPSFLINGTPIIGAMPIEDFEAAIERSAQAAKTD